MVLTFRHSAYGRRISPAPLSGMSGTGLREYVGLSRPERQERLVALGRGVAEFERIEL
jgi:hypothetical protein